MNNQTMIQYFEWSLPSDGLLWRRAGGQAQALGEAGFDMIWLPPAYKGAAGGYDVGYGVYDLYDLGEFDQKGTIRTKYGTRDEYLAAIGSLQKQGLQVLADIVLNQRIGADATEMVEAKKFDPENRLNRISDEMSIEAWTKYTFPGRNGKYSDFIWNWTCFSGIDWDERTKQGGVYQFEGKQWSPDVDDEKGNFDYLMGADVDVTNPWVMEELIRWGKWYLDNTGINGVRLDAIKHIDSSFYEKWLDAMREHYRQRHEQEMFAVGEYWSDNLSDLTGYLEKSGKRMWLFDVRLHMNLMEASREGSGFGMQHLFNNTLVHAAPDRAVTFVDNHDTQPGQALQSWVQDWFKPIAYASILLRRDGIPCVFYGDYYGMADGRPPVPGLKRMLAVRKRYAYGEQHDYLDHDNVVGWTREGDAEHPDSGCAVLMSDGPGGEKEMFVGNKFKGQVFRDATRRIAETVIIGENGSAVFKVAGGSLSIWLSEPAYREIVVEYE